MTIVYVENTSLDKDKFREVKIVRYGDDVQTPTEVSPWGIDSNPVKEIGAAFSQTEEKGAPIVLGYFIKGQKAQTGETRLFATNSSGEEKTRIWLHADGTIDLGGTGNAGNPNHAAQYEGVEALITELREFFSDLQTALSGWTPVSQDGGAALKTALVTWLSKQFTEVLTDAKLDKIKTE